MGWADLDDGLLLNVMASRFDALITVDKNLPKPAADTRSNPTTMSGAVGPRRVPYFF
jgi:hypothetical protein